jgi:tetratricopeptide (TPR) repeat protein
MRKAAKHAIDKGDEQDREQMHDLLAALAGLLLVHPHLASRPAGATRPVPATQVAESQPASRPDAKVIRWKRTIREAIAAGNFALALTVAVDLARNYAPKDAEAHALAAKAALGNGDVKTGAAFATSGLALDPKQPGMTTVLGRCHAAGEDWSNAVFWFKRTLELQPQDAAIRLNLGVALVNSKQNIQAAEQFAKLVTARPDDLQARYYLARTLVALGRRRQALEHWRWMVGKHPGLLDGRMGLGKGLLDGMFPARARVQFRRVVDTAPAGLTALAPEGAGLGLAPTLRPRPVAAEALKKKQIEAWFLLAVCLQLDKEYQEAIACYNRVLTMEPDNKRALNELAGLYVAIWQVLPQRGELLDLALRHWRRSLQIDPNQPEIQALLKEHTPER